MQIKFWYDYAFNNQFLNNFLSPQKIEYYQKTNDTSIKDPLSVISTLADNFVNIENSFTHNCSASIEYNYKYFLEGKNIVPVQIEYFDNKNTDLFVGNSQIAHWARQNWQNTDILVWHPQEGYPYAKDGQQFNEVPNIFYKLHEQFPNNKIIFVCGCLKQPVWTEKIDWLIYKPFDYWWLRTQNMREHIADLDPNKKSTANFSYYNRKFRISRAVMYKDLLESGMLDNADYTYHAHVSQTDFSTSIQNSIQKEIGSTKYNKSYYQLLNSKEFFQFNLDTAQPETGEWIQDTKYKFLADRFYNHSYLDLITETYTVDEEDNLFITEKTYRPIASGNIFLVAGQPGILQHLKSQGIQTFDDIFDESYDNVSHFYERWKIIKKNIQKWIDLGLKKQQDYYKNNFDKIVHNRNIIFNRNFINEINDLFDNETGFF